MRKTVTAAKREGVVEKRKANGQQVGVEGEGDHFEEFPDVWPPHSPNRSWRGFLTLAPLFRGEHILPQGQYPFSVHVGHLWELVGGPTPVE